MKDVKIHILLHTYSKELCQRQEALVIKYRLSTTHQTSINAQEEHKKNRRIILSINFYIYNHLLK